MKKGFKRVIYDFAGYVLVVVSPFVGAIPGPGGLVVFFAGLSILAIHNHWAEKIIVILKEEAADFLAIIFRDNNTIKKLHDIIGGILLCLAIILAFILPNGYNVFIPIFITGIAGFELLYNRKRYKKFRLKH